MIEICIDGVQWSPTAHPVIALPRDRRDGTHFPRTAWGSVEGHPMFPAGCWLDGDDLRRGFYSVDGTSVRGIELPASKIVIRDSLGLREITPRTGYVLGALLKWRKLRCVYVALYGADGRYHVREVAAPIEPIEAQAQAAMA